MAISYSGRAWQEHARPLHDALVAHGLSVYAIQHAEDSDLRALMTNDPLWQVRYREGIFRSRYVIPVCTPSYLDAEGSRVEMFELSRLAIQHRGDEHFYPILPWFPAGSAPASAIDAWKRHGADQRTLELTAYDPQGFQWLRHLFPFPTDWGFTEVAGFIHALSEGARASERGGSGLI